jgi:hypothetical protein
MATKNAMVRPVRAMAMATRVAGNKEGTGKINKSNGIGNKEGNGDGSKSNGGVDKQGEDSKRRDGNSDKQGDGNGGKGNGDGEGRQCQEQYEQW